PPVVASSANLSTMHTPVNCHRRPSPSRPQRPLIPVVHGCGGWISTILQRTRNLLDRPIRFYLGSTAALGACRLRPAISAIYDSTTATLRRTSCRTLTSGGGPCGPVVRVRGGAADIARHGPRQQADEDTPRSPTRAPPEARRIPR